VNDDGDERDDNVFDRKSHMPFYDDVLMILEYLLLVKQEVRFTFQYIRNLCYSNCSIITFEPLLSVLSNIGRIVTSFNGATMTNHGEQRVPIITLEMFAVLWC